MTPRDPIIRLQWTLNALVIWAVVHTIADTVQIITRML